VSPRLKTAFIIVAFAGIAAYKFKDELFGSKKESEVKHKTETVSYTRFVNLTKTDSIHDITVKGEKATAPLDSNLAKNNKIDFETKIPEGTSITADLKDTKAVITAKESSNGFPWTYLIYPVFLGLYLYVSYKSQLANKFKAASHEGKKITFDDVAGIDEAKAEIEEIRDFLKNPKHMTRLGAKMPKGALLIGPPGTGKTLLAKALAGESDVPFISVNATDFENKWYGGSKEIVKGLFKQAMDKAKSHKKKNGNNMQACVIFIDEIDAVGSRNHGEGNAGEAHKSTLLTLLAQMDGFNANDGVVVLAATNKPEDLDPALVRPGRFDRRITVPLPDEKGREAILKVHTRDKTLDEAILLNVIARSTRYFSGADLANLVNEATIIATKREGATSITSADFEEAMDKVRMGAKSSITLSKEEEWKTAIHEAGHAILLLEKEDQGTDLLHKVTIIPRGQALGVTLMMPMADQHSYTKQQLESQLAILYAGRAAEELFLGGQDHIGTGASNDIERATDIVDKMVTQFGFSALGPIQFSKPGPNATEYAIFKEKEKFTANAYKDAATILYQHKDKVFKLAQALAEKETLDRDSVLKIIDWTPKQRQKFVIPQNFNDIQNPFAENTASIA
jgi:cell division protease FtsH